MVTPRLAAAQQLVRAGKLAPAETEARAILSENANDILAQVLLASILFRTGRLGEADAVVTATLGGAPKQVEAVGVAALIKRARNDWVAAADLFERAIDLGQRSAGLYNQIGTCRLQSGNAIAAGTAFRKAIELDRSLAASYYNLGLALASGGKSEETFATFKIAIDLDPNFLDSYFQLWEQMRVLLNWDEGIPILEAGRRRHPQSNQLKSMLALSYGKAGRAAEAEPLLQQALAEDPGVGLPYAHWLQEEGRFDESIPLLKREIERDPGQAMAYYNLSVARCFEVDGKPLTSLIPPLMSLDAIGEEGRLFLHYALARARDNERDYERAMAEYDAANAGAFALFHEEGAENPEGIERDDEALARLYTHESLARYQAYGSDIETPIFIVGMIRTGTTLLDQILASHRDIASAGEQPFWLVRSGRMHRRWSDSGFVGRDLQELAGDYVKVLRNAAGPAKRVVDKMPTNFPFVGLMSATYPRAKFIHMRRDPMDTVVSIWTTFLGRNTDFAYDQGNIVEFYRYYLRTMEHWRCVLAPGLMLEVRYEELVSDKERVVRDVLSFLGLDWDEACLHHESNVSQVSTPSLWTARQPVNTGSVGRWKRYEPWLGKLLELRGVS